MRTFAALFMCLVILSGCSSSDSPAPAPTSATGLQGQMDQAKDGDVITIPAGTYDGPFTISHAITLKGQADRKAVHLSSGGTVVTVRVNGVNLSNLSIDHGTGMGHCISFQNCKGSLENCELNKGGEACLHATGTEARVKVTNCDIKEGSAGVYAYGGGKVELIGCEIHHHRMWGGESRTPGAKITLTNCKIHDCKDVGLDSVEGGGYGIIDSVIYNNLCGVSIRANGKIEVKGGKIYDNQKAGINLMEGAEGSIQNCEMYNNTISIAWLAQGDLTIANNKIHNDGEYGLAAGINAKGLVTNNEVYKCGLDSLCLADGAKPLVTENSFHNNDAGAFYVSGTGSCAFEQNEAYDNHDVRSEVRSGATPNCLANRLSADQKLWLLSCIAVVFERNQHRHDLLPGAAMNEANIQGEKELLSKWWGITTRQELLDEIKSLWSEGHRSVFADQAKIIGPATEEQFRNIIAQAESPKAAAQFTIVRQHCKALGTDGILAWDICRIIGLARWGYASKLISEDEAWAQIIPAGKKLQSVYKSGDEMGEVYYIGYTYWQSQLSGESPTSNATLNGLNTYKARPDCAWHTIPWTLDLTPSNRPLTFKRVKLSNP